VRDPLPPPNRGENLVLLLVKLGRDQAINRGADHLFGCVAENPLCRSVPGQDYAVEGLADDRIVGRLDDRGKSRGVLEWGWGCVFGQGQRISSRKVNLQFVWRPFG
jgi:hypothetical protein